MDTYHKPHNDQSFTTKETITYVLFGIALLGGSVLLGRNLVKKGIANNEEKKSIESQSPSNFAKRIKMAFDNDGWLGTDEDALRTTLREIPNLAFFKAVALSYQKLYSNPLMKDLEDELTSSEFIEMTNIIAGKSDKNNNTLSTAQFQAWAKRLKAAFDYTFWGAPATDEEAVSAVFNEMPSQAAFAQTSKIYQSLFGKDLISALKSELEFWEYADFMKIITSKPQQ